LAWRRPLQVIALDDHEAIAVDARHVRDRHGVGIQLIYKSEGQPLAGRGVIALHAQLARRVALDRAFEDRHQRLAVAGQVHGLEAAGARDLRVVGTGEHQRVIHRAGVIGQFHRRA
jgi:hypothetical protein